MLCSSNGAVAAGRFLPITYSKATQRTSTALADPSSCSVPTRASDHQPFAHSCWLTHSLGNWKAGQSEAVPPLLSDLKRCIQK